MSFASVTIIVACLLIMGSFSLVAVNINSLIKSLESQNEVVAFISEDLTEKQAMAHSFDGRASLVVGTHTHVPSADHRVLPGGTAFQTDAGMCGDYDSVIGMQKGGASLRFWRKVPAERLAPAEAEATICGLFVETDDATGLARRVEPLRLGGSLSQAMPAG